LPNATIALASTTINGDAAVSVGGTIAVSPGSSVINAAIAVPAGGLLRLNGNNGFADLTTNTSLSNAGTIELTGTSWAGRLSVGGTLLNGPGGTLRSGGAGTGHGGNEQPGHGVGRAVDLNAASADHQTATIR
jgi:hypothetical protein